MPNTVKIKDLHFKPFIEEASIRNRLKELGDTIRKDYEGKKPVFLGVLNGAFIFMADLVRTCNIESEMRFIRIKSYMGLSSSGNIQIEKTSIGDLKNRHVIIVEDIIDTGNSMAKFIPLLQKQSPASIAMATLLFKPASLQHPVKLDYIGFEIPPKFVIGYGLDYNGWGRQLPEIYQLADNPETQHHEP